MMHEAMPDQAPSRSGSPSARVFGVHACRCRYPTQPDHHGDDVDINFYQVEIPSSRADRSSI